MTIRSKLLIHWTGNSGENDIEQALEDRPNLYLVRLIDYYKNGLYTKRKTEATVSKEIIKNLIRLCFTEIRLSQIENHADQYGKLGIGFARDFIIRKGGNPVIYLPVNEQENSYLLEESINKVHKESEKYPDIHKAAKLIKAHVKRMSSKAGFFDYYDEMEWRIVHDETDNTAFNKGHETGIHRLEFNPTDIKIIIFPDDKTRQLALDDETMKKYFNEHLPVLVTLEDCASF